HPAMHRADAVRNARALLCGHIDLPPAAASCGAETDEPSVGYDDQPGPAQNAHAGDPPSCDREDAFVGIVAGRGIAHGPLVPPAVAVSQFLERLIDDAAIERHWGDFAQGLLPSGEMASWCKNDVRDRLTPVRWGACIRADAPSLQQRDAV